MCATDAMKVAANIDSASGSFEKVLRYLPPMMNQLTVPMMIIGLEPFDTFYVSREKQVVRLPVRAELFTCTLQNIILPSSWMVSFGMGRTGKNENQD